MTIAAEATARWRATRTALINDLKSGPCVDCGGSFSPECMDFDHVRGQKLRHVSGFRSSALETLLAEIKKCDLVCANCHRIRTKERLLKPA